MKPLETEAPILSRILKTLTAMQVFYWRNNSGRKGRVSFGDKGSPDIMGVVSGGRLFGLEVKSPVGKVSEYQLAWAEKLRAKGGYYAVVRSVDEAVIAVANAERGCP